VSRVDVPTVVVGALVSLGLIVPVALIARLAAGGDDVSSGWNSAFTVWIIVATLIGGVIAGRRQPDTPMIHGAAAGALAYVAARVVSIIASGEIPNIIALVFALLVFAAIGAIGGFVASVLTRPTSGRTPEP
jgi:putative membrane protein (TIGR04086 family)